MDTDEILILTDTHFGIKSNSKYFRDYQVSYFVDVILPLIREQNYKKLIFCGDFWDNRKSIHPETFDIVIKEVLDELVKCNMEIYMILGNHDIFYRNTLTPNTVDVLEKLYPNNITVIRTPIQLKLKSFSVDLIPWICKENEDDISEFIKTSTSRFCFGHLEVIGAQVLPNIACTHGSESATFSRYDRVFSGHFHKRSVYNNIEFIGNQFQFDFSDLNFNKGYCVFNESTGDMQYIETPESQIYYSINVTDDLDVTEDFDTSIYTNKIVKVRQLTQDQKKVNLVVSMLTKIAYKVNVELKHFEEDFDVIITDDMLESKTLTDEIFENWSDTITEDNKQYVMDLYTEAKDNE